MIAKERSWVKHSGNCRFIRRVKYIALFVAAFNNKWWLNISFVICALSEGKDLAEFNVL